MGLIEESKLAKLFYFATFITGLLLIFYNKSNRITVSILVILIGLGTVYYKNCVPSKSANIVLILVCFSYYYLFYIDTTGLSLINIFIVISIVTLNTKSISGLLFVSLNYIATLFVLYLRTINIFSNMFIMAIQFYFVYTFAYLLKYQLEQKEKLTILSSKLKRNQSELEVAYNKIQENMSIVEEATILRERNRLSGEIHDAVGHTLTTSLVQLEASKRLIDIDKHKAIKALDNVQSQLRKGLKDIRLAVKDIYHGSSILDFESSIRALIKETENTSGVNIKFNISSLPDLSIEIKKTIFRVIQESLTNSIRHSKSVDFDIDIKYYNNNILCVIKDYGVGSNQIKFGYGLSNMKNRVEKVNGSIEICSKVNVGTTIIVDIPVD